MQEGADDEIPPLDFGLKVLISAQATENRLLFPDMGGGACFFITLMG